MSETRIPPVLSELGTPSNAQTPPVMVTDQSDVWVHITARWRGRGRVWFAIDSSQFHTSNIDTFAIAFAAVSKMNRNSELEKIEFAIQPYDASRRMAPAAMRNLPGW